MSERKKILVIKHGSLGDIVLATGPMKAIRTHHPHDHITALTTAPYAHMLEQTGWFNDVWVDSRPKFWNIVSWLKLFLQFNKAHFNWVYDLQTSSRSSFYHKFFIKKPNWSGIAPGASHRHDTPHRTRSHTIDRQKEQLAIAGIQDVPPPDVSWLTANIKSFNVPTRFALLVPGGSAHRPQKRWPEKHYIAVAQWLAKAGITPVLIGTRAEEKLLTAIAKACPEARNLCNTTRFEHIAELARHAVMALGNDTGPMHLIAAAGCPSTVLFSAASDPALCGPRAPKVTILRADNLATLAPEVVQQALQPALAA